MDDLSRLIESALEENHATLRKAAMGTIASMGPSACVRDLLESEAAMTIRSLSLEEFAQALREARQPRRRRVMGTTTSTSSTASPQSSPRRTSSSPGSGHGDILDRIAQTLEEGPLTVGQIGRELDMQSADLRTYLQWMLREGRITRSGRARATRYHLAEA